MRGIPRLYKIKPFPYRRILYGTFLAPIPTEWRNSMRHGRPKLFWIALTICVFFAGCGSGKKENESGVTRWGSFPVPIYTDPAVVSNAQVATEFRTAMAFWEQKVGKQVFDYRGNWNGQAYTGGGISQNALFTQSPWNYASNIAAQTITISQKSTIQSAVIMVNPGTQFCNGECSGQENLTSIRKVFTHELGHFIGLSHSNDAANVMYPTALPGGSIDQLTVDMGTLSQLTN